MRIPSSKLGGFASELVNHCLVSQRDRVQRGMLYKNLYLTGSEDGDPAIYNKTFSYVDDIQSLLYSPVALRYMAAFDGAASPLDRVKGRVVSNNVYHRMRNADLDTKIEDAVTWSLVKGKTFLKLGWGRGGLDGYMIQPESMGVLQENLPSLDPNMEAFVHSIYITPYQFERLIAGRPDEAELRRKGRNSLKPSRGNADRDDSAMKQIIVGGLQPFRPAGVGQQNQSMGQVDWMGGPSPVLAPEIMQQLLRLDELWVWDDNRGDWATIQIIGDDCVILGKYQIINAFAYDPATGTENEYLKGEHPFVEVCANPLNGFFWGRSEVTNIGLLQKTLNSRVNGINQLLRRQEDPPTKFTGTSGINQNVMSRLKQPGGYFSDSNPNAKVEQMGPEIPAGMYESIHETERWFNEMGGLPPITKGHGESGVRSQGHAETLVRMASPRFKDRAILVERSIDEVGSLVLSLCKAHVGDKMTAWVNPKDAGIEQKSASPDTLQMPPVPGQIGVEFLYAQLPRNMVLQVEAHSSSPAFSNEARGLMFDLAKIGGASPEDVIERTHPPGEDELIAGTERREAEKAALAAQHPELLSGGKKKH